MFPSVSTYGQTLRGLEILDSQPVVFIVDDDEAIRVSLSELVASANLAVETFADAMAFLEAFDPDRVGCLLLDIRMPGMSGMELLEKLTADGHGLPVIIITGHGDTRTAVQAIKAGAVDFVDKPFRGNHLLNRIQEALVLAKLNQEARAARRALSTDLERITPTELEVLKLTAQGFSLKQVAGKLCRSYKTVDKQKSTLMAKLGMHSSVELTRWAIRAKLVKP